jgi:Tfp pilus assembly protein PilO
MQQHRIISLLSILVMVIIPVVGWFLVAQPQLAAAAEADQKRADTEVQIAESTRVVAQLKADSAKLPELNDDLNDLRTSIPASVDSSGYIDGIDALARTSGVTITVLTVDDPVAYTPADGADDEDADEDADNPLPPAVVTDPLIDGKNFVAIPVTVGVSGSWAAILNFVDGLQSSPRQFLVTDLRTSQLADGATLSGSISGYIYAIPTGVEGKPRPISTTVKQLGTPEQPEAEGEDESDGEPTPDPTTPPAP